MRDIIDILRCVIAIVSRTTLELSSFKGIKGRLVVFDVIETISITETKIVFLVRVFTEGNLIASYNRRRILIVPNASGLEFYIDGLGGIGIVHHRISSVPLELRLKKSL